MISTNIGNYKETIYPQIQQESTQCNVNLKYKIFYPRVKNRIYNNSITKNLYSGIPNYYPLETYKMPINTLYNADASQFDKSGFRESYHYKIYPFTHRHAREIREYENFNIPIPNIQEWTKYRIITDGGNKLL